MDQKGYVLQLLYVSYCFEMVLNLGRFLDKNW